MGFSLLDIGCLRWRDIDEQLSEIIGPGEHGPVTRGQFQEPPLRASELTEPRMFASDELVYLSQREAVGDQQLR